MTYADFLATKARRAPAIGRECAIEDVHPLLHPWQREAVAWAVRTGRAALWWDTGLGKTLAQVEWARLSGERSLIVAPLAVCQQTVREAAKIGVRARYVREDEGGRLQVTNYEMADRFAPDSLVEPEGELFPSLGGVGGRARMRRQTLDARCERAAELVAAEPDEAWLLWAGLNDEADRLATLTGAVNVHGGMTPEAKAQAFLDFADGKIRRLVTKCSLAAFGLNWQHCARMAFVGLSDSYEAYYQAIRRCYRYGQTREVHAHVVLSEVESSIAANVTRKEAEAAAAMASLVAEMRSA